MFERYFTTRNVVPRLAITEWALRIHLLDSQTAQITASNPKLLGHLDDIKIPEPPAPKSKAAKASASSEPSDPLSEMLEASIEMNDNDSDESDIEEWDSDQDEVASKHEAAEVGGLPTISTAHSAPDCELPLDPASSAFALLQDQLAGVVVVKALHSSRPEDLVTDWCTAISPTIDALIWRGRDPGPPAFPRHVYYYNHMNTTYFLQSLPLITYHSLSDA